MIAAALVRRRASVGAASAASSSHPQAAHTVALRERRNRPCFCGSGASRDASTVIPNARAACGGTCLCPSFPQSRGAYLLPSRKARGEVGRGAKPRQILPRQALLLWERRKSRRFSPSFRTHAQRAKEPVCPRHPEKAKVCLLHSRKARWKLGGRSRRSTRQPVIPATAEIHAVSPCTATRSSYSAHAPLGAGSMTQPTRSRSSARSNLTSSRVRAVRLPGLLTTNYLELKAFTENE